MLGVALSQPLDRDHHTPAYVVVTLAALGPPQPSLLRVIGGISTHEFAQYIVRFSLEGSEVALVKIVNDFDQQSERFRDYLGGLARAQIWARDYRFRPEHACDAFGCFLRRSVIGMSGVILKRRSRLPSLSP